MEQSRSPRHFSAALTNSDIRLFIGSIGFFTLAGRALAVIVGFQIYQLTHSVLALGWLGLIEAIPAISVASFGGYVADRFNRRNILLTTRAASVLCALAMAFISWKMRAGALAGLYAVIFLAGVSRGFSDPAATAFEALVVPKPLTVNASSWISSTWISSAVLGPAVIGFVYEVWGAAGSYLLLAGCFVLSWIFTAAIPPKPQAPPEFQGGVHESILVGWRYLFKNQPLITAMALDLFSIFFGGAVILLPVYANDILHVGARGLGLLNAATSFGALFVTLAATHRPPIANAGRDLLLSVTGFGVSILLFAFSKNFALSLAALFLSGAFDGISMVIRRSMLRLLSPDPLRGRIAAASSIFVCASNELGAFESGMVAAWIGTVPCVAFGGVVTLLVVTASAWLAPQLRMLRFDVHTLERKDQER